MDFDIIIPARYASTRLPGKPLLDVAGKTLIERVYLAAKKSSAQRVIVATDDERIESEVEKFGGETCMTSIDHVSGTDRLAEVVKKMDIAEDRVLVNVQGDEPFIDKELIDHVGRVLLADTELKMSTAYHLIESDEEINNPNVVKVVVNDHQEALYFSRSPIPFHRSEATDYFQHMGIYGYRAGFIQTFSEMPPSSLELSESLEQLRVLQAGYVIKLIKFDGEPSIGVDTQEDLQLAIERIQATV
jgi:3-deoxy-manno-octulosonate cytidylyltransferase (CMP-KDO synthetase)